jgi:tight adherence protein C
MKGHLLGYGLLFGTGAFLLALAQPLGRPLPPLAERLRRLGPEGGDDEAAPERAPLFRSAGLDAALAPALEAAGGGLLRLLGRLGLSREAPAARLAAAGSKMTPAQLFGQKLAFAAVGLAFLPAAQALGVLREAGALWLWLLLATAAFAAPDLALAQRAAARRRAVAWELGGLLDTVTLAVSAGIGVEQALQEAALAGDGILAAELRAGLREARLAGRPVWERLEIFGEEVGVPEVAAAGAAIGAAIRQGAPVLQALRAQAEAVRDRRRLELLEAGERAAVRMLLPVGGLILPAFFLAVLFPAAVQLLGLTRS